MALTRREAIARATAAAAGGALGGLAPAGGAGDLVGAAAAASASPVEGSTSATATYLAFMDTIAVRLDRQWSSARGAYRPTVGGYSTVVNARMLQVHAGAAAAGHAGASRRDERVLALTATLLEAPAPWRTRGDANTRKDKMFHLPGWTESLSDPRAAMDKAVDPQVAEALTAAWRAADALGMDAATRAAIVGHVSATARDAFFRYPGIRLNQLNWNCALYALDAELTGSPELLREDYRRQLLRFTTYATRPQHAGGTPNLGPGWHFTYLPDSPPSAAFNLDSAEYANETIDAVRHYRVALAAGMRPLPAQALGVLRAYAWRTLYGDWAHSGYLNWDTGLGSRRRYIGKVFALAQQGLLAIATSPDVHHEPQMGRHARWLFDRGLELYLRWADADASGLAPPVQFGERSHPQGPDSRVLFAARMASNAAQALALGLPRVPPAEPPPMYSFDPDTQRLAVSTPAYSMGILVHDHHAVTYGGIDPNRLFDSRQRPVACTAGAGIANFIARVRDRGGRVLLSTQLGDAAALRIAATERDGTVRRADPGSPAYPAVPYAGPMRSLRASGRVARGGASIATEHELLAQRIELAWELALPAGSRWEIALPSYGPDATIAVRRDDGRQTQMHVGTPGIRLADVQQILVRSGGGGAYAVKPRGAVPRATLRAVRVPPGSGAARPGPTLLIAGAAAGSRRVELALDLRVL